MIYDGLNGQLQIFFGNPKKLIDNYQEEVSIYIINYIMQSISEEHQYIKFFYSKNELKKNIINYQIYRNFYEYQDSVEIFEKLKNRNILKKVIEIFKENNIIFIYYNINDLLCTIELEYQN